MDTFPSSPPAAVRDDLAARRTALDQSGIPPKSLDRNVLVATWNVRGFGKLLDKWDSAAGDSSRRHLRDVLCLPEGEWHGCPGRRRGGPRGYES